MIIYSITIIINNDSIVKDWEYWMKTKHIPDVMATNIFKSNNFLKDVNQHNKYIIQYTLENISDYIKYKNSFASKLQDEHFEKFGNHYKAWRSILTKENLN